MGAIHTLEKLAKLAIRRHINGIPDQIICFDDQGDEVSWADVCAASPKGKQGALETVTPTPEIGYFCDIVLKGLNVGAREADVSLSLAKLSAIDRVYITRPRSGLLKTRAAERRRRDNCRLGSNRQKAVAA